MGCLETASPESDVQLPTKPVVSPLRIEAPALILEIDFKPFEDSVEVLEGLLSIL